MARCPHVGNGDLARIEELVDRKIIFLLTTMLLDGQIGVEEWLHLLLIFIETENQL